MAKKSSDEARGFRRPISTGLNDRPRDEPIGQTADGLPDDSSAPVALDPAEERRIAARILNSPPPKDEAR